MLSPRARSGVIRPSSLLESFNLCKNEVKDETRLSRAPVNKLVPCTWSFSGALEVWRLRLRLRNLVYHLTIDYKNKSQFQGRITLFERYSDNHCALSNQWA